jgi:hypothetical protein
MHNDTQRAAKHCIKKDPFQKEERISFTFRSLDLNLCKVPKPLSGAIGKKRPREDSKVSLSVDIFYDTKIAERCEWKLNPIFFQYVTNLCEQIMCRKLTRDVYATIKNRQILTFGANHIDPKEEFLYINGDWALYDHIIPKCILHKITAVIVAPLWEDRRWLKDLRKFSTHCFLIPEDEHQSFFPQS